MSLMGTLPQPGMVPGPTFNSGHAAMQQQHHLYGGHPHGLGPPPGHMHAGPPNDRPFKCDQCPQSFNRNHDLKRHRRIHLEVKPFPCAHCVKSFSRKDALKVGRRAFHFLSYSTFGSYHFDIIHIPYMYIACVISLLENIFEYPFIDTFQRLLPL